MATPKIQGDGLFVELSPSDELVVIISIGCDKCSPILFFGISLTVESVSGNPVCRQQYGHKSTAKANIFV